jgi:hypothetical protein
MTNPLRDLRHAWSRFLFEPQPTSTLALFRIGFGLVATGWIASQAPDLMAFYGPHGILPTATPGGAGSWGVLQISTSPALVVTLFAVSLAAAVALTLGLFTRVAAVLVWVGVVSFEQRNSLVTNSGDGLVRNLAFFCMLAPSGAALSLDRLRRCPGHFWEFPDHEPWALRLVQLQLSIGYLSAVWHKSGNALWRDGTAVSYAIRMQDIHRFATPGFVTHSVLLTEVLTYGTLVTELSLGVLVWNRAWRPWVLLLGVLLHLSIDESILVGFFSDAMLAGYLAFVDPRAATRAIEAVRDRLSRRTAGREPYRMPSSASIASAASGEADGSSPSSAAQASTAASASAVRSRSRSAARISASR